MVRRSQENRWGTRLFSRHFRVLSSSRGRLHDARPLKGRGFQVRLQIRQAREYPVWCVFQLQRPYMYSKNSQDSWENTITSVAHFHNLYLQLVVCNKKTRRVLCQQTLEMRRVEHVRVMRGCRQRGGISVRVHLQ